MFSVSNSQITIEHNSIQLIVVSYLMSCLLLTITIKHDLNDLVNASLYHNQRLSLILIIKNNQCISLY